MSVTGTGLISLRKQDLEGSKPIAIGFKKLVFAHKATAGETGITLTALTTPSQMSSAGFVQPTSAELTSAKLLFYRKNLKLISSISGELMDFLSYTVASNSRINFNGFTAANNEIFIGIIDHEPATGLQVVDAVPLVATGAVAAGLQDVNTGDAFEVNKYPTKQVGAVTVFVDGVQQLRNVGNAVAAPGADGNYQEIDNGSGLGSVIRLNTIEAYSRAVVVLSNGLLVNRRNESRDQALESLAGQVDKMIPDLAAATGNPTSNYQAAPNNVDIKSFGDNVNRLQRYRLVLSSDTLSVRTAFGPTDLVMLNTSSGAGTFVLPLTPNAGDYVELWDSHDTWGTFGLTISRNGNLIEGAAADFTVNTSSVRLRLVYVSAARGWIIGSLS